MNQVVHLRVVHWARECESLYSGRMKNGAKIPFTGKGLVWKEVVVFIRRCGSERKSFVLSNECLYTRKGIQKMTLSEGFRRKDTAELRDPPPSPTLVF